METRNTNDRKTRMIYGLALVIISVVLTGVVLTMGGKSLLEMLPMG